MYKETKVTEETVELPRIRKMGHHDYEGMLRLDGNLK